MSEGQAPTPGRTAASIAVIAVFSALIAVGTFFSVKLPVPLGEITWSPPIYLALGALVGPGTSVAATALGSFIGESLNVALLGWPAIYAPGIVWARAPEALIMWWASRKGTKTLAAGMIVATVFETLAFFLSDWMFYTFGLFGYGAAQGLATGFWTASVDFLTLLDLAYVPVTLVIIRVARPAFKRLALN